MYDDLPGRPVQFVVNIADNLNNGEVWGDQRCSHPGPVPEMPPEEMGLPRTFLARPLPGFAPQKGIGKARKVLREGILFLAGDRGTGRRTIANELLGTSRRCEALIHCLSPDLDFARWVPEPGAAHGYLVDGLPDRLMRSQATMVSVRERLLAAGAVMVVVLPVGVRLDASTTDLLGSAFVRCPPPPAEEVFAARFKAEVPDEPERHALMQGLSEIFPRDVLLRDGSPQDAMDVLEAVRSISTGSRGSRMAAIDAALSEKADHEIREFLPEWFVDQNRRHALISAAVFAGMPPEVVAEQARRLARLAGQSSAPETFLPLEELLGSAGARVETVRHGCGDPPVRVVFARSRWARAILRRVWQGPSAEVCARWLQSVTQAELIVPAGRALALSAILHPRHTQLTRIRTSAVSGDPCGRMIAAAALQTILSDPDHADEAVAKLGGWVMADDRLRHVTALTCGGGAERIPVRFAFHLVVRLIRSTETDRAPRIAAAVDEALMDLFHRGDRAAVLREMARWTESGQAEARYATALFPKLLSRYLTWFHTHAAEEAGRRTVALMIRRVLRSGGPSSVLRGPMLAWQRYARLDPGDAEAFEVVLDAVHEDRHPEVRRFLTVLDRHS